MDKIIDLVKVEITKIFKRKSTYILLYSLIIISCFKPIICKIEENRDIENNFYNYNFENNSDLIEYIDETIEVYQESIQATVEEISNVKDKEKINELNIYNSSLKYNIGILKYLRNNLKTSDFNYNLQYANLGLELIDKNNEYTEMLISPVSEVEYNKKKNNNMSYEKYKVFYDYKINKYEEDIILYEYALKNDCIKAVKLENSISRYLLDGGYNLALVAIIVTIIISIMISKEYLTGTIRLSMIRPCKRYKILLAKIISAMILIIIMSVIAFGVLYLTTGCLFGFEDFEIPKLTVKDNKVINNNFILTQIKNTSISLVPSIFIIAVAICVAIFSKSSVMTVAFPLTMYFAATVFNTQLMFSPKSWVQYSIIPYFNLNDFFNKERMDIITENNIIYDMNISLNNGIVMLVILTVVLIISSIIKFNKSDIKNV